MTEVMSASDTCQAPQEWLLQAWLHWSYHIMTSKGMSAFKLLITPKNEKFHQISY